MKQLQYVIFDDYNKHENPDKQGEDGDAGGSELLGYPCVPVGLWLDTR
jgi:hypothetical protein